MDINRTEIVPKTIGFLEVMRRAIQIIERGPLPNTHSEHGGYCPYCALALAKSQLDNEYDSGLSDLQVLNQIFNGLKIVQSDTPLLEARYKIGNMHEPFNRETTLKALYDGCRTH